MLLLKRQIADACIIVISAEKLLNVIDKVLLEQTNASEPTIERQENYNAPSLEPADNKPVSITNRNGTFVISLPAGLAAADLAPTRTALQGLLFIKPLHSVFDFNDAVHSNDQVLLELEGFIQEIRQVGGEVRLNAGSHVLRETLHLKYSGIPINHE